MELFWQQTVHYKGWVDPLNLLVGLMMQEYLLRRATYAEDFEFCYHLFSLNFRCNSVVLQMSALAFIFRFHETH